MKRLALLAGLLMIGATELPAASPTTADQQLVAGLELAGTATRAAAKGLVRPSPARVAKVTSDLRRAVNALGAATKVAPRAVGALETPSVRIALSEARVLDRQATVDVSKGRYSNARLRVARAVRLMAGALQNFGIPLEKEFPAFAVRRDFSAVRGFENYSGLSATVESDVNEVVIGAADRVTANAGEPGGSAGESAGLPITEMSVYIVSDPIGRFRSGWCNLADGLIVCDVSPAMTADNIFTIAFAPKLERGTKLLVKFRSTSGQRSYAVFSTR